jgi:anti-anti-sigma regulatory factor
MFLRGTGIALALAIAVRGTQVVLRIYINTESDRSIRLSVEGWLVGPWVQELRKQSEQALLEAEAVTLDLEKLLFMDTAGAELLRELATRHVAHVNCSTFIRQQLKETAV